MLCLFSLLLCSVRSFACLRIIFVCLFFLKAFDFRTYLNMNRSCRPIVSYKNVTHHALRSLPTLRRSINIKWKCQFCSLLFLFRHRKISRSINWNSWPFEIHGGKFSAWRNVYVCVFKYVDLGILVGALVQHNVNQCYM